MSQTFNRREALKTGAAASAFAGVTILASRKTLAQLLEARHGTKVA